MAQKNTPKRSKKTKHTAHITYFLIVAVIILLLYFISSKLTPGSGIAVIVNGEAITTAELDEKYEALPEQYKAIVTKELLLEQMINTKVLVQEAEAKGITATEEEIQGEIDQIKIDSFHSDYEFQKFLEENEIDLNEIKKQIGEEIMINKLLDEEILSKVEISDEKVRAFYDENRELLGGASYEDVKEQIKQSMLDDLSSGAINTYIEQLKSKAKITMPGKEEEARKIEAKTTTFTDTKKEICEEDGKPIVRLYTTSTCEPCSSIKDVFYSAALNYAGEIVVYHWELDTGDNLMTSSIEGGLPKEEVELFKEHNTKSTVPTFIFGCRYVKTGGEGFSDLEKAEEEFEAVIEMLLE